MVRIAIALAAIPLHARSVRLRRVVGRTKGLEADPGVTNAWSNGSGAALKSTTYPRTAFDGTRQDLASRVTIDALIRDRGAKLSRAFRSRPAPDSRRWRRSRSTADHSAGGFCRSRRRIFVRANQLLATRGLEVMPTRLRPCRNGSLQPPLNDSGLITGPGLLFVVSGPSGAGKDTLVEALRRRRPESPILDLGDDAWAPAGGANGEHYFFVSKTDFEERLRGGGLLGVARVRRQPLRYPARLRRTEPDARATT